MKGITEKQRKKRERRRDKSSERLMANLQKLNEDIESGAVLRVKNVFCNTRNILRGAHKEARKASLLNLKHKGLPRKFARDNMVYTHKMFIEQLMAMQEATMKGMKNVKTEAPE